MPRFWEMTLEVRKSAHACRRGCCDVRIALKRVGLAAAGRARGLGARLSAAARLRRRGDRARGRRRAAPRTSRISAGSTASIGRCWCNISIGCGQHGARRFRPVALFQDRRPAAGDRQAADHLLLARASRSPSRSRSSMPLGVLAAVYPNSWVDRLCLDARRGRAGDAELLLRAHSDHGVGGQPALAAGLGQRHLGAFRDADHRARLLHRARRSCGSCAPA